LPEAILVSVLTASVEGVERSCVRRATVAGEVTVGLLRDSHGPGKRAGLRRALVVLAVLVVLVSLAAEPVNATLVWADAVPATFGAGVQNATPNAYFRSVACASAGNCTAAGEFEDAAGGFEAFTQTSTASPTPPSTTTPTATTPQHGGTEHGDPQHADPRHAGVRHPEVHRLRSGSLPERPVDHLRASGSADRAL
jgi:hypothetical protein